MKAWTVRAKSLLEKSLGPVRHELSELDWKSGLSPDSKKLGQHLCAFSNYAGGGFLVFGVSNHGVPKTIGSGDAENILNTLSNIGREAIEPPICLEHAIEEFRGEHLLFVHISESETKPVHIRNCPMETFVRSTNTTRKASKNEVGSLMLNSKSMRWEEMRATSLLSDDEIIRSLDTPKILQLLKKSLSGIEEETLSFLTQEKYIVREPSGGGFITNLGVISAAESLSPYQDLSRKAVRVVIYSGLNKTAGITTQTGVRGYAVGFEGLLNFIESKLPKSEVIEKVLRKDRAIYPIVALREIIANSLIHQDFTITGAGPMIEIYDDRIEISNPGSLLPNKTADRLIGTQPESRNQELANAFMRYRLCEQLGSGLERAVRACELYGLPPLDFVANSDSFKVVISHPKTFAQMSHRERLNACFQHATLKKLNNDVMTNKSLRERLKMPDKHRSMVSVLIQEAIEEGLIKKQDPTNKSKKYSEYVPYWA